MRIMPCTPQHAAQILEILNEAILHSTALYDYHPRPPESMVSWFEIKQRNGYPVIGAFEADDLLGFATYGGFRPFPAYKYTVEHSVYVASPHRGKGLGKVLLTKLVEEAQRLNYHLMVGCIDSQNAPSIALHKSLGFAYAGTIRQAGYKFGQWLDIDFYQKVLPTPAHPVEG